ncbi:MAG: sigma-E processing peptidase SpoIIGA, partial [Oscillospiraceae bacterium]
MYIYVDILIITNIYIDFLLIKATARLSHSAVKNSRCIIAAAAGSLFSLIILLPELNAFLLLLLRIISAAVMVAVSFGKRPFSELYKIGLM